MIDAIAPDGPAAAFEAAQLPQEVGVVKEAAPAPPLVYS
jgi:hypothetical protein